MATKASKGTSRPSNMPMSGSMPKGMPIPGMTSNSGNSNKKKKK